MTGQLCRLPTQLCEGCGEAFPDDELDQAVEGAAELYCADCLFTLQKRSDEGRDEECYG